MIGANELSHKINSEREFMGHNDDVIRICKHKTERVLMWWQKKQRKWEIWIRNARMRKIKLLISIEQSMWVEYTSQSPIPSDSVFVVLTVKWFPETFFVNILLHFMFVSFLPQLGSYVPFSLSLFVMLVISLKAKTNPCGALLVRFILVHNWQPPKITATRSLQYQ